MQRVLKEAQAGVNEELKVLEENPDAQNALTKEQEVVEEKKEEEN